ncbi:MAG: FMN adenylyltransferase [Clostridiales bacterium]|jgi:riboflavin kinase/FMN adenylyltransferase|nr:FMN adenylyltransferase [Clostridiales bacterium]
MHITGIVSEGKRIGRRLGFPTANILPDPESPPPKRNGVYIASIALEDGRTLPCILNQGRHPTLPEGAPTIEAHVLDFDGDLYGQRVEVLYLKYLRPERRFESPEALRSQIASDETRAREWLAGWE